MRLAARRHRVSSVRAYYGEVFGASRDLLRPPSGTVHLDPSRVGFNPGELEIRARRCGWFQFRRFQDRLSAAAHKLNVEFVLSTLADLP
jgi:hypothetical protein